MDRGYYLLELSMQIKIFCRLLGTKFRVIASDKNKVEVSFTKTWNPSNNGTTHDLPLNIDKR